MLTVKLFKFNKIMCSWGDLRVPVVRDYVVVSPVLYIFLEMCCDTEQDAKNKDESNLISIGLNSIAFYI
jgi:hypothetical protein